MTALPSGESILETQSAAGMHDSLVSAIIPTYNRANFISKAVRSVIGQTYRNLEVIVVDDGSTDGTGGILRTFRHQIRVVRQANRGPSAARNTGLSHAQGSLIAFLDSDDIWLPDKIERQVELLAQAGQGAPCCVCNASLTNARLGCRTSFDVADIQGKVKTGLWRNPTSVLAARFVLFNQAAMVRREVLETAGGFREDLWLLEDYDLAIRLSLLGPWGIIRDPLVIKQEETADRLSVAGETDPMRVLRAKEKVLVAVLSKHVIADRRLRRSLVYALLDVRVSIIAKRIAIRTPRPVSSLGRLLLRALHLKDAAWRRSSLWPKADVVPLQMETQPDETRFARV